MDLPFDNVFVINLDRRPDRWRRFNNTALHQGLSYERFAAVDGQELKHLPFPVDWKQGDVSLSTGVLGCWLTHRLVLEEILRRNIDTALILEDDVTFPANFRDRFNMLWQQTPLDWDMLYLARANWDNQIYSADRYLRPLTVNGRYVPEIFVADRNTTAYSYAVHIRCIPWMLQTLTKIERPIDEHYARLHKSMKVYAYHPALVRHSSSGKSDIVDSEAYHPESSNPGL